MPDGIYTMTTTLQQIVRAAKSDDELLTIKAALDGYCAQVAQRGPEETPVSASRDLHAAIDRFIVDDRRRSLSGQEIRCQAGCAHCCKQTVAITIDEAHELVQAAAQAGIAIDQGRLRRQLGRDDASWQGLSLDDRSCAFLGADGRCRVYDARPMACRKYFSVDPPDLCNIERYPGGDVRTWYSFDAEALTTAAFTLCETDYMPEMLLQVLTNNREEQHEQA